MRRNFPRTNKPAGQNGPLMTNHIELQNLDLELELLKRKREIIEKQQMQLSNERQFNDRQRQYNYNEPSRLYQGQQQQYNSNQNFSNNFGQSSAPPLMGGHFGGSILGKRPSESKWNPNSAPKRFSGPQGGSKKKFGGATPNRRSDPIDRPAPFAKNQGPIRSQNSQPKAPVQPWNNQLPFYMGTSSVPPSQRFSSSRSRPVQRDFKPSKVTKPKPTTSNLANKLVSYPIPKRKENPTETPKLANKVEEPRDDFILHADRVPSQQVAGRLELGLGTILKDVKQQFAENDLYRASFLSHVFMREVKQAIRERLRTVMIGKQVGKVGYIVEEYRKVFPLESDSEIVTVAFEAVKAANNKQISIRLENTDTPESYFKTNMDQLICKTLDEIFKKVRDIYGGEHGDYPEEVHQTVRELMEEDPQAFSRDFEFYNDNVSTEKKDKNVESVKKDATTEEKEKNGENDKKEETDKKDKENDKNDEANNKKDEEKEVVNASNDKPKEDEPKIETGTETNANTSNASDLKVEAQAPLNDQQLKQRIKKMEYVIGYMLKRRIALIFPKYKNLLSRILNEAPQYLEAKEAILAKLQDKLSIETRMEAAKVRDTINTSNTSMTSQRSAPAASTPTAAPKFLPYYVKIFGRPGLPRRKQMHTFLQQFSPKTIKKHKKLNLLFVGFNNKEDFDKILAVKETVLGNCKIRINVSDKNIKGNQNETLNVSAISGEADDDVQLVEGGNSLDSSGIINADLDDQIDNLLSSIRQEEEANEDDNAGKEAPATDNGTSDDVVAVEQSEDSQSQVPVKANEVVDVDLTENDQSEKTPGEGNAALDVPAEDKNEEIPDGDKPMETEPSEKTDNEEADKLAALKNEEKDSGRATPTRASARIATPSTIRTRRASRLAQN